MGKADKGINLNSPDVKVGLGSFVIPKIRDEYVGEYAAKRQREIFRHGHGKYITKDGQTYEGHWSEDNLAPNTEVTITYSDGCKYVGMLLNYEYTAHGKYVFPDSSYITCDFVKNLPTQNLILIDRNEKSWKPSSMSSGSAMLYPVNYFSDEILENLGTHSLANRRLSS